MLGLGALADRIQGSMAAVTLVDIVRVGESDHSVLIPQYGLNHTGLMDPPVLTFQSVVVDHRVNFCLYVRLQNGKTERVPYSAVTLPSPSHISVGELAEMERACIERTLAGEPRVVNLRMKGDLPLDFPVIAYDQLVLRKN